MWQKLLDFSNKLFALMRRVQKIEEDNTAIRQELKEVRQDIKELNQKVDQIANGLQRIAYEFQRDRENAEHDRENQRLRLEILLLRSERGSPLEIPPRHDTE